MGTVEDLTSNKADHFPEEAKEILKSLATQWDDVLNANELQVIPLKGALTNEVFQIKWPTKTEKASRRILVRIYGEGVDGFFDRDNERQTFEFMSKNGRGPRLLGQFANGRIEEFINARTLSASDLRDPAISGLIAAKLKEFHDFNIPGPKKVHLWDRLRIWFSVARRLSPPEEADSFSLDTIEEEISILEKELPRDNERLGFCHNDLQYGNILLDEGTNSMILIDYEYSSYNPVAYDIANHFLEMAANYHGDTPHILEYSKYPGLEERKKFVHKYLTSTGGRPSDYEVEQLLHDIEKYTLASHLFWGLWGVISGHLSKIGFDYMEYAKQRFQQYWSSKYSVLGSVEPSPAGVPNDKDKPSSCGVIENKPSATSSNTDKPSSSAGVTENKPALSSDKPSSDGVTSDKSSDEPSPASVATSDPYLAGMATDIAFPVPVATNNPSLNDLATNNPSPAGVATDNLSLAGLATDKPSPAGMAVDNPSLAGLATDKPSPAGVATDNPFLAGLATDEPSLAGVATDNPSLTSLATDKPSPAGVATNDPSLANLATDKPSLVGVATDNPSLAGLAPNKPSPMDMTTDNPSLAGLATDKPSPMDMTTDNPSPAGLATDTPSPAGLTSDKPSSDSVTGDKLAPASVSNDKPLSSGVAGDKPSTEGAAADEASTSVATKDGASSVGSDEESSNAKGHNLKNASVFKRLKKYLSLSFLRQNKN